jgi:DNA-binding response OmpR family regulator
MPQSGAASPFSSGIARTAGGALGSGAVAGEKILIVDDDADLRELLNVRLRQRDYDTAFATDAISAISVARRESPNLIILDLGLPAGEGYVVIERLKAIAALGAVPIIVLSGRVDEASRERAIAAGARRFIPKPFDTDVLLRAVEDALGKPPGP